VPSKKEVPSISTALINMEEEQEPMVLHIKGFLNFSIFFDDSH